MHAERMRPQPGPGPLSPGPFPPAGARGGRRIFERLEREIHGLLVDMGVMEQRTDEFVDQEAMVRRFMDAWGEAADTIEKKVIAQMEKGKEISL